MKPLRLAPMITVVLFGLLVQVASAANPWPGYTLYSPMPSMETYLIDNDGDVFHTWNSSSYRPGLSAYLLDDGSLMRTARLTSLSPFNGGGRSGRVEQFSWDGTQQWEYEYNSSDYRSHHDIEVLPNGNVLMIAWEMVDQAGAIAAGRDPGLLYDNELWPDHIIEVEPTGSSGGNIVWEWHAMDHLIQDYDAGKANYGVVGDHPELIDLNFTRSVGVADWLHINSIDYNADLDQILLSVHGFSEIWIIDHDTTTAEAAGPAGDLLYRWGNPEAYDAGTSADRVFYLQHDAEWIEEGLPGEGNLLVFNNGSTSAGRPYSSVDELTPPLEPDGSYTLTAGQAYGPAALEWIYTDDPATDFFASGLSGSQRLPNGNALITDGPGGIIFEVDAAGSIVWQYDMGETAFRADRFGLDFLWLFADFDDDGDADADDIDLVCDNLGDSAYDRDGDGDADEDDMIFVIENLIQLQDGSGRVGTKRGDFNLDGLVNATDLAIMGANFGGSGLGYADGNANCDDVLNATDLAILSANFGFEAPASPIPEPATVGLLALGGLALLRRRK
ncbi:MAG: aryl-sulfate sulfotransferase [Planctomycetota bacterium]|jgi:hypothetical protein